MCGQPCHCTNPSWLFFQGKKLNEDEEMMHNYGEQYGDGVEWAEKGQGSLYYLMNGRLPSSTVSVEQILVYFTVGFLIIFSSFISFLSGSTSMAVGRPSLTKPFAGLRSSEKLPGVKRK